MANLPIELKNVRVFDVLVNALNGELGAVVGVAGDKLDLVIRTGVIVRFKHGPHFSRVSEDEAIAFRALTQSLRRERLLANPRKKRAVRAPSVRRSKRSASRRAK
jgi:ribosomal protein S21